MISLSPSNALRLRRALLYLAWLLPTLLAVGLLILGRGWPWSLILLVPLLARLVAWGRSEQRAMSRLGWLAVLLPLAILGIAVMPGLLVSVNPAASLTRFQSLLAGVVVYVIALTLRGPERKAALALFPVGLVAFCLIGVLATDWNGATLFPLPALYDRLPHLSLALEGSGVLSSRDDINPRMVGGICAILLLPAIGVLLQARAPLLRMLVGAAVAVGFATLASTQSVEALIGLVVGAVVFVLAVRSPDKRTRLLPLAYFGLLALLALPLLIGAANLPPLTGAMVNDGNLSVRVESRLELWNRAYAMLADGPLTGVGLNNFPFVYHNAYQGFIMDDRAWAIAVSAHNGYLQAATDGGVAGLVLLIGLLAAAYFWWRRAAAVSRYEGLCAAAALAGVAAFAGFNLIDSLTLGAKAAPVVWLLLGLLASSRSDVLRIAQAEIPARWMSSKGRVPVLVGLLIVATMLALSWQRLYNWSGAVVEVRSAIATDRALGPDRPMSIPGATVPQAAQDMLAIALADDPSNPALLYQQGLLAFTYSDYDEAAQAFEHYRQVAAVRSAAAYYQGWALFDLGRDSEAVESWQGTGSADVLLAGGAAISSRSPAAAAEAFAAADSLAPGHIEPLLRLAELSARSGDRAKARGLYQELQRRFPRRADPYIAEAHLDQEDGQGAAAIAVLLRGVAAAASPGWLLDYELSRAYAADGDLQRAMPYATSAAAGALGNETVQDWLAELKGRLGEP